MKIQNEIEIAAPPDELFEILSSPERVAPCMPGASLEGKEGDDAYEGTVKLKVGPITAAYQGTLRFVELDRENRRAVMRASGQETNGQGNAEASPTAEAEAGKEATTEGGAGAGEASRARPAPAAATAGEDSLDLLSVVGIPGLGQAVPAVAGLALGLLIGSFFASRRTVRAYQ